MHPIYSGEICGPSLGMKVEIWNEDGQNIESTGAKGDLVITKPFFSMPITFWGADGMEKYRKAYFDKFPRRMVSWRFHSEEYFNWRV